MTDISAILTLHNEGPLAAVAARSALACRDRAAAEGIAVEIIAMLDRADGETADVIGEFSAEIAIVGADCGDPGEARNFGVQIAKGDYVSFLDGDDLWGEEWLLRCFALAKAANAPRVYHPEVNLYFGAAGPPYFYQHLNPDHPDFSVHVLAMENYWTALCFVARDVLVRYPFDAARIHEGFGHEDWHWNIKVASNGIGHAVVPGTIHFIRRKLQSRAREANMRRTLIRPCPEFSKLLYGRQSSDRGAGHA